MYRFCIILLFFLFLFISSSSVFAEDFNIKHADSLSTDKDEINIKGNIIVNYKDAQIEAPEGIVHTDEKGQPETATFIGRPKLKLKDRKLEADKIVISLKEKLIQAEGNTVSELKDKKNNSIVIFSNFQNLSWTGENANVKGNVKTLYKDTVINSEEGKVVYKNKKPNQAVFFNINGEASFEQPNNQTMAKEFVFDLPTQNVTAYGNVDSLIWADETKLKTEQDPVMLSAEELFIDNDSGTVTAKSDADKVKVIYQETKGESNEAFLVKNRASGKPEKIIFRGKANVVQLDKELISEEVLFNFKDKKLTSNTKTNIRPKTIIYKKG